MDTTLTIIDFTIQTIQAPNLPNPVATVRQDPRLSRDPRQRPAPPVNVVKPINNAPATAVSPGTICICSSAATLFEFSMKIESLRLVINLYYI